MRLFGPLESAACGAEPRVIGDLCLGWIFFLVISILGIVNVCNGEKKELPIVSGIRFIRR